MSFIEFINTQKYDLLILAIFILLLVTFLIKNKKLIHWQKILAFGKLDIIAMCMVKTGWGLKLMDSWAKKYGEWVRVFGFVSVGVGFIGVILNLVMLAVMFVMLFTHPQQQQVGLVLPFTEIPGLGYLSFTHWIIAIFILATVHEFAHGVVARVHNVKVNTSGFAVLTFPWRIPLIPAAFVEPDEKQFKKESDIVRYSVLAAGPISNIFLAIPFLLIMLFILNPLGQSMTEPVGFSFAQVNETLPAGIAGLEANQIYTYYNGKNVTDSQDMLNELHYTMQPGDVMELGFVNETTQELQTYQLTTTIHPDDETKAYMGVVGVRDNREFTDAAKPYKGIYNWFSELVKWLFIFNLFIGLMNLMPLYITDGGQIMHTFAHRLYKNDKVKAERLYRLVCNICFYIIILAFIVPFITGFL